MSRGRQPAGSVLGWVYFLWLIFLMIWDVLVLAAWVGCIIVWLALRVARSSHFRKFPDPAPWFPDPERSFQTVITALRHLRRS
jgi:hypothetical protein